MDQLEEYLYPRKFKFFSVGLQIFTIVFLFVLYTLYSHLEFQKTGTVFGYPPRTSILFVPIYEEIIFRGLILIGLTRFYSQTKAIIISSLLFGVWHFKNIFFIPLPEVVPQMLYAGLIFGPITAYITVKTKNVWLAVILHYLNNILAPLSVVALTFLRY